MKKTAWEDKRCDGGALLQNPTLSLPLGRKYTVSTEDRHHHSPMSAVKKASTARQVTLLIGAIVLLGGLEW